MGTGTDRKSSKTLNKGNITFFLSTKNLVKTVSRNVDDISNALENLLKLKQLLRPNENFRYLRAYHEPTVSIYSTSTKQRINVMSMFRV